MRLRPLTNRPAPEGSSCDLEDVSLHHSCLIPHHYPPRMGGGGRSHGHLVEDPCVPFKFMITGCVMLQVEYKPCVVPASCWDLMREFLQGFLGSSVQNTAPQYLQNRINEVYQPIDTIQQYLDQFMLYRKATGVL
uniref:Mediator of RNA polymerase II transcription subunit 20 n=1 Tax=Timema cristinae TaxID=61476 RepID=A0A7R9D3Q8_TIMCR|nr:unnamed protein product [Timema cristinae]